MVVGPELPLRSLAQLVVVITVVHLVRRHGGDEDGEDDDLWPRKGGREGGKEGGEMVMKVGCRVDGEDSVRCHLPATLTCFTSILCDSLNSLSNVLLHLASLC